MEHDDNKNIKDLLDAFIRRSAFKDNLDGERVRKAWFRLFDKNIASYTMSLDFKEGVLKVRLSSAPLREELSRNKKSLIEHLNRALGDILVHEIRFL